MNEIPKWKSVACCVLYVTFIDGNIRTFFSRDIDRKPDNLWYWKNYLEDMVLNRKQWAGRVRDYAIFRSVNGTKTGDPIVKGTPNNILNS